MRPPPRCPQTCPPTAPLTQAGDGRDGQGALKCKADATVKNPKGRWRALEGRVRAATGTPQGVCASGCRYKKNRVNSLSRQRRHALDTNSPEIIGEKLSSSIPRDFLLSLERLMPQAFAEAMVTGMRFQSGHRPTATGFARHLLFNEALGHAMDEAGIKHPPLKGNMIVFGKVGVVTVARVHMGRVKWDNGRRSKTKVKLCAPNVRAKKLVHPDLFEGAIDVTESIEMTAFILTEGGDPSDHFAIHVVVTDETMDLRNPLFREELHQFLQRYQRRQDVQDRAQPRLKSNIKKLQGPNDGESERSDSDSI